MPAAHEVEIHHIRALKDLKGSRNAERPPWVKTMAARKRKTLIVCKQCHGYENKIFYFHLIDYFSIIDQVVKKVKNESIVVLVMVKVS